MFKSKNMHEITWRKCGAFFILGLILALAQAPFNLSFTYVVVLPFIGLYVRDVKSAKLGFVIGWWLGFGYFVLTIVWIVEPFFVTPEVTGWMAPFALAGMAGGLSFFWALAFYVTVCLTIEGAMRLIFLALCWTLFEFLRANILTGFPWGHLSYGLIDLPIIQLTAWVGIHGLGLILLIVCFLPAILIPRFRLGIFLLGATLVVLSILGLWRSSSLILPNIKQTIVRVVQPNAAQHLKWRSDMVDIFYVRQLEYTSIKEKEKPDVVIWPETALPQLLENSPLIFQEIAKAAGPNTSVITGIVNKKNNKLRNSLIVINPAGTLDAIYDKKHLVPFGEYMPLVDIMNKLGLSNMVGLAGNFKPGQISRNISVQNFPDFIALICYEAIFPEYSSSSTNRPEWIVHITNDAWFGSFSGPYQHLVQARVRAIEQGLPLVRSANTGISAMIDPYGRVLKSLKLQTAGYFDHILPAALPPTLYAKIGELGWLLIFCFLMFFCIKSIFKRSEH